MIGINDTIKSNSPKSLDGKFLKNGLTPYTSIADVNSSIPQAYRHLGLTVLIQNQGVNKRYTYLNNIADNGLIPDTGIVSINNISPDSIGNITLTAGDITGLNTAIATYTNPLATLIDGKASSTAPTISNPTLTGDVLVPDLADTENSSKAVNAKFVQSLFSQALKSTPDGILSVDDNGNALLGGSLLEDAEIDLGDKGFTLNSPADTGGAGSNYFKWVKGGVESFYRSGTDSISKSYLRQDGDELSYTFGDDNSSTSSTLQIRKQFISLANVDKDGNKVATILDNTTDKATLSLLYTKVDGTQSKGLVVSGDTFKIGYSADGEENVSGFEFTQNGVRIAGTGAPSAQSGPYSVLLKDQATNTIAERNQEDFFPDSLTDSQKADIAASFQPLNGDLTALSDFGGKTGVPQKMAENTWVLNTGILPVNEWYATYMFSYATASFTSSGLSTSGLNVSPFGASSPSAQSWSITNHLTRSKRLHYSPVATTAGSVISLRTDFRFLWRGNATGLGGFRVYTKWGHSSVPSTNILFCGLTNSSNADPVATVDFSTLPNIIGVCKDAADPMIWSIIHNDATGACTKVSTGIPIVNTTHYALEVWCFSFSDVMYVSIRDLASSADPFVYTAETNIPDNVTPLGWMTAQSNNATDGNFTLSFSKVVIRHNN